MRKRAGHVPSSSRAEIRPWPWIRISWSCACHPKRFRAVNVPLSSLPLPGSTALCLINYTYKMYMPFGDCIPSAHLLDCQDLSKPSFSLLFIYALYSSWIQPVFVLLGYCNLKMDRLVLHSGRASPSRSRAAFPLSTDRPRLDSGWPGSAAEPANLTLRQPAGDRFVALGKFVTGGGDNGGLCRVTLFSFQIPAFPRHLTARPDPT